MHVLSHSIHGGGWGGDSSSHFIHKAKEVGSQSTKGGGRF